MKNDTTRAWAEYRRSVIPRNAVAAVTSLLLLTVSCNVTWAAPKPKLNAIAKIDRKTSKLLITGRTSALPPNQLVSVYDAEDHRLMFSGQTNEKSRFSFTLSEDAPPCRVQLESNGLEVSAPVIGTNRSCKAAPACSIAGGDRSVTLGAAVNLEAKSKTKLMSFDWNFGDGAKDTDKALASHTFKAPGLYRVTATGETKDGKVCMDSVTVSVVPGAGTNPYPKVAESGDRPALGSGMPSADGKNDVGALVIFPFEDTGMEGGSQINIPYNVMVPYNALNAQVIRKVEHKPKILDDSEAISVNYSAASNPLDPVGADSINSTSQNLFVDGFAGANFDPVATAANAASTGATAYLDNHAFTEAVIAKTEFWDKVHQPNASIVTPAVAEKGLSQADTQNAYTPAKPLVQPDQGLRGSADKGAGVRAMPGIADPYKVNDPQGMVYNSDQRSFVAQNIPATSVDDKGRVNPYPLMRVEAKVDDSRVAATDAVYTTASETNCRGCHTKGEKGADDKVWRTPVRITELKNEDGSPGPATGAGSFPLPSNYPATIELTGDPIADFKKYGYGPAVHAIFNGKFDLNPNQPMVAPGITLNFDDNGLRTDRVAESRWLKPDGATEPTNPSNDPTWRLQIRLKFKDASDYGEDTWQNQEKAARWNAMLVHDYMTPINYNNARDDVFTDYVDDKFTSRNAVSMCASHHTSTQKYDAGSGAVSTITTLSQFTRTAHAFHGKMQVYKRDVAANESADHQAHKKGDLIRDGRGHPIMYGGRGWDSVHLDEEGMYLTKDANGEFTVKSTIPVFAERNNWDPDQFPAHALGEKLFPVGENVPMEKNCLTCHTGQTEKSYRDIHHSAGLKCDSCHGDMLAVGLVYPNEKYNGNLLMGGSLGVDDPHTLTSVDFRRQWLDEPDCGSCHVGDANLAKEGDAGLKNFFSPGALKQAWQDGDPSAASMHPVNARFAVMPTKYSMPEKVAATANDVAAGALNTDGVAAKEKDTIYRNRDVSVALYRKSGDVHGSGTTVLNCSACHGASHGVWPNKDPNANDNVTARQLQGYDGNIAECSTCHIKDDFKTGLVATDGGKSNLGVAQGVRDGDPVSPVNSQRAYLAGPHGMHPVGDEYWYKHAQVAGSNSSSGKHNPDLNGGWHNDMAKKPGPDGEDQCAACHGDNHKGTRLSRSLVDRELINSKGKKIKVAKDQVIGCDLCHSLKKSFTGAPNPSAPNGGWPKAKLHAPPMPESVSAPIGGGGGGHH